MLKFTVETQVPNLKDIVEKERIRLERILNLPHIKKILAKDSLSSYDKALLRGYGVPVK